jgi:hypothetical protein
MPTTTVTPIDSSTPTQNDVAHVAPRMEWSKRVDSTPMDATTDEGWRDFASGLLRTRRIEAAAKRDRWTWADKKKTVKKNLIAKECSPGLLPYLLPAGQRRGSVASESRWTMVPFDLDAVGLPVDEVLTIVDQTFAGLRRLVWTTWSCRDGKASVRVMLILDRTASLAEVALAWWWGRRALLDAGLPEVNVKDGGPTVDPCALDGRLFYLPAAPTPMVPGTEDWGGTRPRGTWGDTGDVALALGSVLAAGVRVRDVDESAHLLQWPEATVPEGRGKRVAKVRQGLKITTSPTGGRSCSCRTTSIGLRT